MYTCIYWLLSHHLHNYFAHNGSYPTAFVIKAMSTFSPTNYLLLGDNKLLNINTRMYHQCRE